MVPPQPRAYDYDNIGNRKTAQEYTLPHTYTANSLNQYDLITTGAQTETPLHDEDGNLTDYKDKKYTYDAENRLITSYTIAKKKKTYYGIAISDYVINYRPTPVYSNNPSWWEFWESKEFDNDKMTQENIGGLTKLKRVRFGFGAARGGRHTFLYGSGSIYEVHWVGIGILGNLYEKSPFENYGWLSGVLMVPPGNGVY